MAIESDKLNRNVLSGGVNMGLIHGATPAELHI